MQARQRAGVYALFELSRPWEALGFCKAKIVIHFLRDGEVVDCKEDDWDDDLNTWLIELGGASATPAEEKDRFAFGLRGALKKPEKRYATVTSTRS